MSKSHRHYVFLACLIVGFILPQAPGQDKTPQSRTSTAQNCADLLGKLVADISKNEKLDAINLSPSKIPEGGVYLTAKGTVVVRQFGQSKKKDIVVAESLENAKAAVMQLLAKAKERNREVVITGDQSLDKLVDQTRRLRLGEDINRVYFSTNPNGPAAKAKRELLNREFTKVQVLMDLDVSSDKLTSSLRVVYDSKTIPTSVGSVEFMSMRDLKGDGNLADRLLAARPPPNVLRITVTHYKARSGEAVLTDGSVLRLGQLNADRLQNKAVDIYLGCDLMPERNGWLVIDGKLLAQEFGDVATQIAGKFEKSDKLTGREILETLQVIDRSDIGGRKTFLAGAGGGGPPSGGDGGNGANRPIRDNERPSLRPRVSFRLLDIIAFALAESLVQGAAQAGCDDSTDDDEKCKGGTVIFTIEDSPAFFRTSDTSRSSRRSVNISALIRSSSEIQVSPTGRKRLEDGRVKTQPSVSAIGYRLIKDGKADRQKSPAKQSTKPSVTDSKAKNGGSAPENQDVKTRWFRDVGELNRIRSIIFPTVLDYPVLFLDSVSQRILMFEPSRQSRDDLPGPLIILPLDAKPSAEQTAKLKEVSQRFWFFAGSEYDPIKTRTILLNWQTTTGVTLPFIFIIEGPTPTSASWTLIKPFFRSITHTGESIPRTEDEAKRSGLFWCNLHHTKEHLEIYSMLLDQLNSESEPQRFDLRDAPSPKLAELLKSSEVNAWLIGVWVDGGLRNPDGLVLNSKWVNTSSCNARIAFVSAYPVSAPLPDKYFEAKSGLIIQSSVVRLLELAREDAAFPDAKESLESLFSGLGDRGGIVAVSSCGKYLLISE
jgi:hypothetical protein